MFVGRKLLLLSIVFLLAHCQTEEPKSAPPELKRDTTPAVIQIPPREADQYFTRISQYISGLAVANNNFNFDTIFYAKYKKELGSSFKEMATNRLDKLAAWYGNLLKENQRNDSCDVFYPFSGGDFLHLAYIYPNAKNYTMLAIEPVGYFKDLDSLSLGEKNEMLSNINFVMRDVLNKSYFITGNMSLDIKNSKKLTGMITPIFWALGLTGNLILDVENVIIDADGVLQYNKVDNQFRKFKDGVKITFRKSDQHQEKTVTYLSCDISDQGILADKGFGKYLQKLNNYNSFLKAASYLPHYSNFSIIRNNILEKSQSHLQDDTGIPYKYFVKAQFEPRLFGRYTIPITDFNENLFQEDLGIAYTDSTKYFGPLVFSMGYHWRTKDQNQMVFFKK